MTGNPDKPVGLLFLLAVELAVALLFSALSWSMTKSLGQGRVPSLVDTASLALPVVAVIGCGLLAIRRWRYGKRTEAWGLAVLPFPISIGVFMLLGAI